MTAKRRQPQPAQSEARRPAPAQPAAPSSPPRPTRRPVRRRPRRRGLSSTAILGLAALVTVLGVAIFFLARDPGGGAGSGPIDGVQTFPNLERRHQNEPVAYAQMPPVGGNHHPAWQNCGVYNQPVKNENAVHSLEHGAVWITYRSDLPPSEVEALRGLARQSGYRLLSPYPDLPSPIVASAWGAQLRLEQAADPRLNQFFRRYEQAPDGPEPGAPCTGGLGRPLG